MFFGKEAKYINRNREVDEQEKRLLDLVKSDDILVLSRKPIFWEKLDGNKLAKFLLEIG